MSKRGRKASTAGAAATKPVVKVKPYSYQPSKAELEEDVRIKATPRELAEAALATVEVREGDHE